VDLIARDRKQIVFVEVKARRNFRFGFAIESVSEAKLQKVVAAGEKWLQQNGMENADYRVDVITFDSGKIQHLEGV
jgi:putative endonuclease